MSGLWKRYFWKTVFFEAAPRPSLFRGVRQFVWNHLESVSCHFAEQLQPLSTNAEQSCHTTVFKQKTPQLADPRNGAALEPTKFRYTCQGCENGIFWKTVFLSPAENRWFWRKWRKWRPTSFSAHASTPTPGFFFFFFSWFRGTKLRPWSKRNSDQNSDHARLCIYHWGQNDYLPNFYSRRIILGNSMSLMCTKEKF